MSKPKLVISSDLSGNQNEEGIRDAYPPMEVPMQPCGILVLVQLKRPRKNFNSGLVKAEETRESQRWESQIGRVVALGPVAYKDEARNFWPEGAWCKVGDYVRVPKHGLDKLFYTLFGQRGDPVTFALCKDRNILGVWTGDPLWEEDDTSLMSG